jgi:hypothetical protein
MRLKNSVEICSAAFCYCLNYTYAVLMELYLQYMYNLHGGGKRGGGAL